MPHLCVAAALAEKSISVVIVGLVAYILIAWETSQKKIFKGPKADLERLRVLREDARTRKYAVVDALDVEISVENTAENTLEKKQYEQNISTTRRSIIGTADMLN